MSTNRGRGALGGPRKPAKSTIESQTTQRIRQGSLPELETKIGAGQNRKVDRNAVIHTIAVDNKTEAEKIETFGPELGRHIVEARLQKGLTQKELANSCNISVSEISEIERGTLKYNAQYLTKIEKVLGSVRGGAAKQPKAKTVSESDGFKRKKDKSKS